MGERGGDSTDKVDSEEPGFTLECDVMVDYLNQSRKPTRAKHTKVVLYKDGMLHGFTSDYSRFNTEFGNIVLAIGTQKQRPTFQV
jgi:hypothetical protein